jgi:hypothetical protein
MAASGGGRSYANGMSWSITPRSGVDDSLYHLESVEMIMRGRFTDQGGLFSYIAPAIKQSLLFEYDGSRIVLIGGDGSTVKGWDDLDAAAMCDLILASFSAICVESNLISDPSIARGKS